MISRAWDGILSPFYAIDMSIQPDLLLRMARKALLRKRSGDEVAVARWYAMEGGYARSPGPSAWTYIIYTI